MESSGVTVLLSAMDLSDISILNKLNISGSSVIIDQCDEESEKWIPEKKCLFVKTGERGLSKSRNMAMRKAVSLGADICIFCDNDVVYRDDYEKVIKDAFDRNPGADIIVFFIERPERHKPVFESERPLDHLHAMKIFSPEIAFRIRSVRRAGIRMDELFGAGAKYGMGEENIFLFDAMARGLKVIYVPERVAGTVENESTWFKGYNEEFFRNRGAGYYRMSPAFFLPLCLQFAVRKRGLYRDSISFSKAVSGMMKGKREYLKEKRYFIVGDHLTGTGPANATLSLIEAMPYNTLIQKEKGKIMRALEIMRKIRKADAVVFSGHSRQNILGMNLARKRGIPSVYIMHGAVEYENKINRVPDEKMAQDEREMMKLADRILAVSSVFEKWIKENYPEYREKTGHLTNGIPGDGVVGSFDEGDGSRSYVNRTVDLLSVGGGMPRKRIVKVCEAVKLLRENEGFDIILNVAGAPGADSDEIAAHDFVKDHGILDKDEMRKLYEKSDIFIQNSVFETFGLAPVEALFAGCDIILSGACGVREVLNDLRDDDIITDPDSPAEIADKIRKILKQGNKERLLRALNTEETCWERRAKELCQILSEMEK